VKFNFKKASTSSDNTQAIPVKEKARDDIDSSLHLDVPGSSSRVNVGEKSKTDWKVHENFIEKTKGSGTAPPPRHTTITGFYVEEKSHPDALSKLNKIGVFLALPVTAIGVYVALSYHQTAQVREPAALTPRTDPIKLKVVEIASPTATATPLPNLIERKIGLYNEVPLPAGDAPKTQALMRLTNQPFNDKPFISREKNVLLLERSEAYELKQRVGLSDPAKTNETAKLVLEFWKGQSAIAINSAIEAVPSFHISPTNSAATIETSFSELHQIHSLQMFSMLSGDARATDRLKTSMLKWAAVYKPAGDAVGDSYLEPLIRAYAFSQFKLSESDRHIMDEWLYLIADAEVTEATARGKSNDLWYAEHLKVIALIGSATGNGKLQNYVKSNLATHIANAIHINGSTTTFDSTDSMMLHIEHMTALIRVARILVRAEQASNDGLPIQGSTFARGIDFALPYVQGTSSHNEYVELKDPDLKKRQIEKDPLLQPYRFQPIQASEFIQSLSYFRPSLSGLGLQLVAKRGLPPEELLIISVMSRKTDQFDRH
jgi:hypothetical protein